jgi:alpha-beta hydrolase superfamily lysophospholipase
MKFLFEDDTFSFETLRTTGFANYFGADLGEVLATAARITDGDQTSWHRAWKATAARVAELGERSLAAGHRVTARDNLLRASNYYRNAAAFLLDNPAEDPEVAALYASQVDTFAAATALFDHPAEAVSIPYQETTLPGYLFLVDDSGAPRPTIIYTSGYDSTIQECYFVLAAAALRRGYNVLAFDGPGQGGALHLQKLVMRPDWEAVITPVLDYALTRPEIEPSRIAGFGYSLGGYLLARAAAFEHRLAALILDDGVHDLTSGVAENLPPFLMAWIEEGRDEYVIPVVSLLLAVSSQLRWAVRNGMWVFGVQNEAELLRTIKNYTLEGVAEQIIAPTLILEGEHDTVLAGQPERVEKVLTAADTTRVTLTEAEGAGEHTHAGALGRAHQVMFDWLDTTLTAYGHRPITEDKANGGNVRPRRRPGSDGELDTA